MSSEQAQELDLREAYDIYVKMAEAGSPIVNHRAMQEIGKASCLWSLHGRGCGSKDLWLWRAGSL